MTTMRIVLLSAVLGACGGGKPAPATAGSAVTAPPALPPGITVEGNGDNNVLLAVSAARASVAKLPAAKHAFVLTVTSVEIKPGKPSTGCNINMAFADANRAVLGSVTGGASANGTDDNVAKDCIDSVTEDLVKTQVAALVAEHDK